MAINTDKIQAQAAELSAQLWSIANDLRNKSQIQDLLRRSRGTGLYRAGVPIEVIAVAMGHANVQTTKDHYAFPSLEQKKEAMNQGGNLVISRRDEKQEWPDDEAEIARICGLR